MIATTEELELDMTALEATEDRREDGGAASGDVSEYKQISSGQRDLRSRTQTPRDVATKHH